MAPYIKDFLEIFLPIEIVYMIIYNYKGLQHPIMSNCFHYNKQITTDDTDLLYRVWDTRKQNDFICHEFECIKHYGTMDFMIKKNIPTIYDDTYRKRLSNNQYGMIHFTNYNWTFPYLCNKKTIINEICKNSILSESDILKLYEKPKKTLINDYFKL